MAQPRSYPKIVQDITGCVQDLKKDYNDTKLPITDDSQTLHKFCAKLEYLLQIDMKGRTSILGGRRDYWDYFYKCLSKVKGLNDGLRFVRAMAEVKSSLGRGRAFIRYSLVHHRLGDSVQQCISNVKVTSDWYGPTAVLLNTVHSSTVVNALYELNDIQFDLSPTGYDLDTAWPTFARKSIGAANLFLWQPPSRTTSTSSINSQQSASDSYPNSPMIESRPSFLEDQLTRLQKEFEECEQVNRQLRGRIDQLEQDNEELHQMAQETEEQMTCFRSKSERETAELQDQVEMLEEGLNAKEEELFGLESQWKEKLQEAEKTASDLYARIEVLNKQHDSREKMLTESERDLREKLQLTESSVSELKQQVIAYEADLAVRTASETSNKEKVSELEGKLADAENRNLELITRMDSMVQNKDKTVSSHFESASRVHELLTRLEGAETEKLQLQGIREELIRKLELVEMEKTSEKESSSQRQEQSTNKSKGSTETPNTEHYLQQIKELETLKLQLASHNSELAKKVHNLEAALQNSATEKIVVERQMNELKKTVSNLEESDCVLREEKADLQRQVSLVEKERDEAVRKATFLEDGNKKIADLEKQLRKSQQEVDALKIQTSKLHNLESTFQQLLTDLETQEQSRSAEPSADSQVHSEAYQTSASDTSGSTELRGDGSPIHSLQLRINSILADKATGFSQLQGAHREVTDLKAHNDELVKQLGTMKEKQQRQSQEVCDLRDTVARLQGELADAGLRSESQKQVLNVKDGELKSLAQQMSCLQQRVSDLKDGVVQKSLELETHQQKLEQANNQLKSFKVSLEKARTEKETLSSKLSSTETSFEALKHEHGGLQSKTQELETHSQEIQEDLEKQKQAKRELESMLEDTRRLVEENVSLEQVFEERKQKMIKEHEDKVEFLTHQFNMIQEETEKANTEKFRFQEEHKVMLGEVQEMREKLELMETERNEIKKTNDTLNTEIARVNEASQLANVQKEETSQKLEQLRSEMFEALEENTTRMLRLENVLHDTQEERDRAKLRISDLETELTEAREKLLQAEQKLEESTQQLTNLECVRQQEVSALKFQLSSEAMEYQQAIQGYKHQETNLQGLQDRCNEQEEIVESLQTELNLARAQLEQQQKQCKDAQELATEKQRESSALQEAIQQMSKTLEELQVQNLNSEEELTQLRVERQGKQTSLESKVVELENDNVELKKQIIKLIKDKDTLWQWTDKLDYQRKMKASERWIDDSEVTQCMQCHVEFSLIVRRHHCRLCGRIFCTKCANCYVSAAHSRKKSRVCEQCFVIHQQANEPDQVPPSTSISLDSDDETERETLARSRSFIGSSSPLSEGRQSVPTTEASSSLEGAAPGRASPEQQGSAGGQAGDSTAEGKTLQDADQKLKQRGWKGETSLVTGSESSYYSETEPPENPVIVLDSPLPSRRSLQSSSDRDEPDFDLISEEEISAVRNSISSPLDSPVVGLRSPRLAEKSTFTCPTLHMSELESGNKADDDITIKAGQSYAVPIHLDSPGITLCWEFASAPKTVAFSVTYQPADSSPTDESQGQQAHVDELIPLCKCNSHRHAVQGELMARKAGIYTLLFDNSFSRFTQKSVKYSLQVKRPEAAY
ncbi:LOW QUALITY PROTEIN: FYVE and coiled-coil domain-containing protein 1-like [Acanthaster planci]|uniref:RUN and FYVE domain-containing protein 4 n=1 Tax=Acanthaster planci TaxID=133434 RepID=A0A8B7XWG7_ACAPL|nr:LOW QUALITY PROTEIN: FYVE and coiled-coil domain-containing protein 1-like [Acanthaster planci]